MEISDNGRFEKKIKKLSDIHDRKKCAKTRLKTLINYFKLGGFNIFRSKTHEKANNRFKNLRKYLDKIPKEFVDFVKNKIKPILSKLQTTFNLISYQLQIIN
ncbi:MAG: hypothetical protein LBD03_00140 [Methanobrevibacter sp.]|jgi:hypothetical protein|nr:hypothetical protein [Candidatus Methanovirga procula]